MNTLIEKATIINEGRIFIGNILIKDGFIEEITEGQQAFDSSNYDIIYSAKGKILIPGIIDDQVHFREPGLTHKGEILTESKAAVAGGVTSYMEMPNTNPQTITQERLREKFEIAGRNSLANYSFYIGATNDNIDELLKTDPKRVCGIKVFMGASTGNMLVDNPGSLEKIFSNAKILVAVHCEDEQTIRYNSEKFKLELGENIPIRYHPLIRSEEACYKSSSLAVGLAKKYNTRLHLLHISTEKELALLNKDIPLEKKQITAEVCVHHLWFDDEDYEKLGTKIKWNPAIKKKTDKEALLKGLKDNLIDVVATDHAPHTEKEKNNNYFNSPSGGPLVQHSLLAMLEFYKQGKISLEKIVEKMCHAPADLFRIEKRGYLRKGYWADLVVVDLDDFTHVSKETILYKCGWSPFEGYTFNSKINKTFVNGKLVYDNGTFYEAKKGKELVFNR